MCCVLSQVINVTLDMLCHDLLTTMLASATVCPRLGPAGQTGQALQCQCEHHSQVLHVYLIMMESSVMQRLLEGRHRTKRAKLAHVEGEEGSTAEASEPGAPAVDRMLPDGLTPRLFWEAFVSRREPVLIEGHLEERAWKPTSKWTNSYMRSHAVQSLPPDA